MNWRPLALIVGCLGIIGAAMAGVNYVWAQVQPAPVSTSSFCYDPAYPRLVLQSGTGARNLVVPEGQALSYQQNVAVLPAESTWVAASSTPWLQPASSAPTTGLGAVMVNIPGTLVVGRYEGALNITITGLYKDAQGNNVSTVVPLPVSLEVIPKPTAGPPPPPPPPSGKAVQIDAASGSGVTVIMRRTPLTDIQVTVNPGQQVTIKGVDCVTTPGVARRCPVP